MHLKIGISCFVICLLIVFLVLAVTFAPTSFFCRNYTVNMVRDFTYPIARRDDSVVDDFHGTKVRNFQRKMFVIKEAFLEISNLNRLNFHSL